MNCQVGRNEENKLEQCLRQLNDRNTNHMHLCQIAQFRQSLKGIFYRAKHENTFVLLQKKNFDLKKFLHSEVSVPFPNQNIQINHCMQFPTTM